MRDAADLSRMLAGRAPQLVRELLPQGCRDGQEWRCGSLAGERGQSLAVHLSGARAGVWGDFSSGERGDALDLVAAVLYGGDRRQAMAWARAWLGILSDHAAPQGQRRPPPAPTADVEPDVDQQERQAAAARIWHGCPAGLRDTPAGDYLAARGLDLGELGRAHGALRCHGGLWNGETRRHWPALVAAISGVAGPLLAIHRTWLHHDAANGRWGKAPLANPKMTLGSYVGGTIRIQRGASGKPLARAPEGETVAIAEGIETALSVAVACPELRVLAAVSLSNMARVELPPAVRHVVLAADNDHGNPAAQRALRTAIDGFLRQGRTVRVAMPETPGADWNDTLMEAAG